MDHWFDLNVVLPKVHRALAPAGHFAVWRTAFGDPSVPVTPFTTFSDWSAGEVEQAAEAVDELGGRVVEHYVTPLIVLKPVAAP